MQKIAKTIKSKSNATHATLEEETDKKGGYTLWP